MGADELVAERIEPGLSHRMWTLGGSEKGHLFLLLDGVAALAIVAQPLMRLTGPALLWVPHRTVGKYRLMAGGEGYGASIGPRLLQETAGSAALAVHLKAVTTQLVLVGAEALSPELELSRAVFAALVAESRGVRAAAAAMMSLHLGTLLLLLWRASGSQTIGASGGTVVQRFRQLIELHYREGLRVNDFAQRLGVTRAQLHHACLRTEGRTPLALLHERLLLEARRRLEQTDLSVEQVGYGIGFRDPGYFNRFFKRCAGQSPGAYRRAAVVARRGTAATSFAAWP